MAMPRPVMTKITPATLRGVERGIREIVKKGMEAPRLFKSTKAITIPMIIRRNLPILQLFSWVGFIDHQLTNQ
jgi:hypothetical protein